MAAEPEHRLLTPTQFKVVGFALTLFALLSSAALLVIACIVLGRLLSFFSSVIWPLAAAGVLALMLRPVLQVIENRFHVKRLPAVIILYAAFVIVLAGMLLLVTPPLVEQILEFISFIPTFWSNALAYVDKHYPEWIRLFHVQMENPTIKKMVDGMMAEGQAFLSQALPTIKSAGLGILSVAGFITHLAILPIYLFFFLLSRGEPTKNLGRHMTFLSPSVRDDIVFLVREFIAIVVSFFRGQLLIGLIMGVMLAIGFTVVGLKFGLFIGLMLGLLNIVPYLGTIIGLSVALPLAFLQPEGGWNLVAWVVVVFIIVQIIEGWFLTPKIMGDRTGLHPVMIIVAIFFWGTAFDGVLGMVMAIPLTAFFVTAWRLARLKYFTVKKEV